MRKIILFFLTLCVINLSCEKVVNKPLYYSVTNDPLATGMNAVYIPSTGTYTMPVQVKFLSGYLGAPVALKLTGLPAGISGTPDTFSAAPNYTENFVFTINNIALGTYHATLTAYTPYQANKVYNFDLIVIPPDCSSLFLGAITGSNACSARSYTYTSTGSASGTSGTIVVNNFGGYGSGVNVPVTFNCDNGTVSIPSGNYGNGVTVQGSGWFNTTQMVINYTAANTPSGSADTCTASYTN